MLWGDGRAFKPKHVAFGMANGLALKPFFKGLSPLRQDGGCFVYGLTLQGCMRALRTLLKIVMSACQNVTVGGNSFIPAAGHALVMEWVWTDRHDDLKLSF